MPDDDRYVTVNGDETEEQHMVHKSAICCLKEERARRGISHMMYRVILEGEMKWVCAFNVRVYG